MTKRWNPGIKSVMKNPRGYLLMPEIRLLIENTKYSPKPLRDKVLISTLAYTGKRISEILSVRVFDINFQNNKMMFHIMKRRGNVMINKSVAPQLIIMLKDYVQELKLKSDDYLFRGKKKDSHLTRQQVNNIILNVGKKCGLDVVRGERIHAHIFRHSFAMYLANKRATEFELQKALDHADRETVRHYIDLAGVDTERVLALTNNMLDEDEIND